MTGIKGQFAFLAQCTWQQNWIAGVSRQQRGCKNAAIRGMKALNTVITTTPSKNGAFSGSIMAETNQRKALAGYVGHMQHNDVNFIQRVVSINCAPPAQ